MTLYPKRKRNKLFPFTPKQENIICILPSVCGFYVGMAIIFMPLMA